MCVCVCAVRPLCVYVIVCRTLQHSGSTVKAAVCIRGRLPNNLTSSAHAVAYAPQPRPQPRDPAAPAAWTRCGGGWWLRRLCPWGSSWAASRRRGRTRGWARPPLATWTPAATACGTGWWAGVEPEPEVGLGGLGGAPLRGRATRWLGGWMEECACRRLRRSASAELWHRLRWTQSHNTPTTDNAAHDLFSLTAHRCRHCHTDNATGTVTPDTGDALRSRHRLRTRRRPAPHRPAAGRSARRPGCRQRAAAAAEAAGRLAAAGARGPALAAAVRARRGALGAAL